MTFAIRNLSVLAYANGFANWHYKSNDTIESICKKDYFANASDMLSIGDIIMICGSNGVAMRYVKFADINRLEIDKLV